MSPLGRAPTDGAVKTLKPNAPHRRLGNLVAHESHLAHEHTHGESCGHPLVQHGDHADYVHAGHMHHPSGEGYEEHVLEETGTNPKICSSITCECPHEGCDHIVLPHAGHHDHVVDGRLHRRHGMHCDDHGPVRFV